MKEYDVIVVGAGPAGSTCASYLSRAGLDVLLLEKEKFPRHKPCGGSQTEVVMQHVRELGAYEAVNEAGFANKGLLLTSPDYRKCYLDAPGERRTTPRTIFDQIMKETAVRWGTTLLEECWVYDVIRDGDAVSGVRTRCDGKQVDFRSRLTIGADGAHSVVAQCMDMFPDEPPNVGVAMSCYFEDVPTEGYLEFHFDSHVLPCYVWIFPTGNRDGLANVGLGVRADIRQGTALHKYFKEFVRTSPFGARLNEARQLSEWRGSRLPCGTQARKNHAAGLLLIGDAASCVLPLTGEGVGPAMESARLAADTAIAAMDSADFSERFLGDYAERWRNAYGLKYRNMKVMEDAFTSADQINDLVTKFMSDETFKQELLKQIFFVGAGA